MPAGRRTGPKAFPDTLAVQARPQQYLPQDHRHCHAATRCSRFTSRPYGAAASGNGVCECGRLQNEEGPASGLLTQQHGDGRHHRNFVIGALLILTVRVVPSSRKTPSIISKGLVLSPAAWHQLPGRCRPEHPPGRDEAYVKVQQGLPK